MVAAPFTPFPLLYHDTDRVWDLESGELRAEIAAHPAAVAAVHVDGTNLITGAFDNSGTTRARALVCTHPRPLFPSRLDF